MSIRSRLIGIASCPLILLSLGCSKGLSKDGLPPRCMPFKGSYMDTHHKLTWDEYKQFCDRAPFVAKCESGKIEFGEKSDKLCRDPDRVRFWITVPDA